MKKSLISIRDFSKEEILHVLETAKEFEQNRVQKFLEGKVIASLFFEPSTRTRLSFETAITAWEQRSSDSPTPPTPVRARVRL